MKKHVIFVAPFLMHTTLRFIDGAVRLPGVAVSLISQDSAERIPPRLRGQLAAHWQVSDALDAQQIVDATRALSAKLGPADRLIGPLEQLQVPLAQARQALGLPGMSPEAAHNFRDKSQMKQVLSAAGVPCARHMLAETSAQAMAFAQRAGFPMVAKPPAGAGGKRTFRLESEADLKLMLQRYPPSVYNPTLLEEFVSGKEHSFDSVVINGKPVWYSISRYLPSPLEVMENPWIQWCVFLPRNVDGPEYQAIREAGFRAIEVLGLESGLSHMEWFQLNSGRIAISEVGARPPGAQITSLLSWAHDLDFYTAWPKLMIFDVFDPPPRRYAVGAAYFRGQGTGRVRAIHGLDEAQRRYGHLVVESSLPKAGQHAADGYEGEGFVIIRDSESDVVEKALADIVRLVKVELA